MVQTISEHLFREYRLLSLEESKSFIVALQRDNPEALFGLRIAAYAAAMGVMAVMTHPNPDLDFIMRLLPLPVAEVGVADPGAERVAAYAVFDRKFMFAPVHIVPDAVDAHTSH